jgi:hypothetical protein
MLDWLTSFANDLGGLTALWQALVFLFNLLVAVANFLLKLILQLWDIIKSVVGWVAKVFKTLWDSFFKKIFVSLFNALRKLHGWLEAHLGPIIKWIQHARAYLDRLFRLYVKPILNMLQHVRQFLGVLRLLHIKWAAALDAKLGKVEADIAGLFLAVRGILTGAIDILNCLADPLNLFRRPTAVLSIRRIIPSLVRVLTGRPMGFFLPSPRKGVGAGLGPLPFNFTPSDTAFNPAASSYFAGDDGLGAFQGFANGTIPDDASVDDLQPLDYFNSDLYPAPDCSDFITCLQQHTATMVTVKWTQEVAG